MKENMEFAAMIDTVIVTPDFTLNTIYAPHLRDELFPDITTGFFHSLQPSTLDAKTVMVKHEDNFPHGPHKGIAMLAIWEHGAQVKPPSILPPEAMHSRN